MGAVVELGEDAAEVRIPGVEVDNAGVDAAGVEVEAALQGTKDGFQIQGAVPAGGVEAEALDIQIALIAGLIAKAANVDLHELGELPGEVFNVDAGAAVDVRGKFVGEEECFHG